MQGISSHFEDTHAFGDTIMTVSLLAPVYMTLRKPRIATNDCKDIEDEVQVLLEPRSCLMMTGDSRYKWRHGIMKTKNVFLPDGSCVYRGADYRRLSLTIRRVLPSRRCAQTDDPSWQGHDNPVCYE